MKNIGKYNVKTFPVSRLSTIDIGFISHMKHHVKALIELDVTEARKMIYAKRRQNQKILFNAWLIKCISKSVEECKELHGIRSGKRKIVLFDDIDISIMIEREINGEKVPLPYMIRKANEKSISQISNEIQEGKSQSIHNEGNYVLGKGKNEFIMKIYYTLPGFLRRILWKFIIQSPFLTKQNMGTVMITSIGMIGRINGWIIPASVHPISFAIGSIIKKPGIKKNRVEIREYLYVTVLIDHDIIDGAPAVRALSKLTRLVEKGYSLGD